jgi:ABC-type Co2+ transport system permease subunit
MNSRQWTMVLWIVAAINVFFGFYKLTESKPEAAIAHFVLALVIGFFAWRRGQKPG